MPAVSAPSRNSQNRTWKIPDTNAGSVADATKVCRPKARSPLASSFRRRFSSRPGWSSNGRPPRAPITNPMTEPTIQATPAVASTIQMLSLPSPASAPAAMSDASPGPGMPAPMIATSTNMIAYSDKSTADHLTMATGSRPRSAGRYRHRRSWRLDLGGARGRPPQEDLPDLRDDDDRQRHGQADEPLPDVEAGGLQERLQRPEHGGEQER